MNNCPVLHIIRQIQPIFFGEESYRFNLTQHSKMQCDWAKNLCFNVLANSSKMMQYFALYDTSGAKVRKILYVNVIRDLALTKMFRISST